MPELFSQILDLKEKDVFLETEVNDNRYFNTPQLIPGTELTIQNVFTRKHSAGGQNHEIGIFFKLRFMTR